VPASSEYGTSAGTVYHYHVTDAPPYTVGCYGPVTSLDACKALYTECTDSANTISIAQTDGNTYSYQQWCTCYQHAGTCNSAQYPGLCGGQGTPTVASESGVNTGGSNMPGGPSAAGALRASPLLLLAMAALATIMPR